MLERFFRLVALVVVTMLPAQPPTTPVTDRGSYTVPGLGQRKQEVLAAGGNSLDLAIAMLETETMSARFYAYGDDKRGDAANFGIFKQNWYMIRHSAPQFRGATSLDFDRGAALNDDLRLDVAVLHDAQARWPEDIWFAGHRGGMAGLHAPDSPDIDTYRRAVRWIREQLDADPANLRNDVRFWVHVPAI